MVKKEYKTPIYTRRAIKRYRDRLSKEEKNHKNKKYAARTFVKKYATKEELHSLKEKINHKLKEK